MRAEGKTITVQGVRTYYLEAGEGPPLILLHSGEFGACGALTWEYNIPALAKHFRVIAPDWLGFGQTEKLFSFEDMRAKRIWHIRAFLDALGIDKADFMGNSMGGTVLLEEACKSPMPWQIRRAVIVSGGGVIPDNESRQILNSYDGTIEYMRKLVDVLYRNPSIKTEAYVERRHKLSLQPGSWECTAAVRFKAPWREQRTGLTRPIDYKNVQVPVLLIAGRHDNLRHANYAEALQAEIPGARLAVMEEGGHCPQVDCPDEFDAIVIDYLRNGPLAL